jgi:hypothetical protein
MSASRGFPVSSAPEGGGLLNRYTCVARPPGGHLGLRPPQATVEAL